MAIRFVLRLLRHGTFFQTQRSNGRIANRAVGFFFIRLLMAYFYLNLFFFQVILFDSQAFRSGRIRDRGHHAFGTRDFKAIKRNVDRIHAHPIRCQRGIMDRGMGTAFNRVARAFLVVLSVLRRVTNLHLSVFVRQRALSRTPYRTRFFGRLLTFRSFFCHPSFTIQGVIRHVSSAHDAYLLSIPRERQVIQTMPTPNLFAWVRGISFWEFVLRLGERNVGSAISSDCHAYRGIEDIASRMIGNAVRIFQFAGAARQDIDRGDSKAINR